MFEQSQMIMKGSYEKSLNLEDIPGLLTANKVKAKDMKKTKSTRVTSIHGSMEAQNIVKQVELVEYGKKKNKIRRRRKDKKKIKKKNNFMCKLKCVCNRICAVKGFKQCPVYQEIKKSVCSKPLCRVDGMKPKMIYLATSTKTKPNYKDDLINEERDNSGFGKYFFASKCNLLILKKSSNLCFNVCVNLNTPYKLQASLLLGECSFYQPKQNTVKSFFIFICSVHESI